MKNLRASVLTVPLLLVAAFAWFSFLSYTHWQAGITSLETFENRLTDLRYQLVGPRASAPEVVFVAIDDTTLETQQGAPAGRLLLAKLIRNIAESDAQSLVLDVLLADAGAVSERASLAASLGELPTVIAAAARFDSDGRSTVIWPHAAFQAQAQVGLVNLYTDAAGSPRYLPLFIEVDGSPVPSMPLLAAITRTGAQARINDSSLTLGTAKVPLDQGGYMPIRLLGPAGTVPTVSASELLTAGTLDALAGKLVVLGYSAAGTGDIFATVYDDEIPGGEIIATSISQLIGGPTLRRDEQTRIWDIAHAALLVLAGVFLMLRMVLIRAIPLAVLLLFASFGVVTVLFAQGLWLSAALPLVAAFPPMALAAVLSLKRERENAKQSEQSLASLRRFQSPTLARQIERDPDYLSTPQEQHLVIFFVDLTGFTALSQQLGQEGTRALLQQFHRLIAEAAEPRQGSVINYMGDGALVVFGLDPITDGSSDADLALAAAQTLEHSLAKLSVGPDSPAVTCRSGLHFGPVILSRLGADNHQQVTVSGDTVNLASRLMEVAKKQNAKIVATAEFTGRLTSQAALEATQSAEVTVRGRRGQVAVTIWPRS